MDKIEIFEETDRNKKQGKLYIVVPCYNEEEALETSAHSLIKKLVRIVILLSRPIFAIMNFS